MALPWASVLVAFRQGHREGGQGGQWPRVPWSLGCPWASGDPLEGPWISGGPWKWHWQISLWNIEDLFLFFEITSNFGENCGIFFFFFGVHKARDAQYLSWPCAHVWLSAPQQKINEYIYCFLRQTISCSLISLLLSLFATSKDFPIAASLLHISLLLSWNYIEL